jgi:hypothetical protein
MYRVYEQKAVDLSDKKDKLYFVQETECFYYSHHAAKLADLWGI